MSRGVLPASPYAQDGAPGPYLRGCGGETHRALENYGGTDRAPPQRENLKLMPSIGRILLSRAHARDGAGPAVLRHSPICGPASRTSSSALSQNSKTLPRSSRIATVAPDSEFFVRQRHEAGQQATSRELLQCLDQTGRDARRAKHPHKQDPPVHTQGTVRFNALCGLETSLGNSLQDTLGTSILSHSTQTPAFRRFRVDARSFQLEDGY